MAITFLEQRKKQKYLVFFFATLVLIILLLVCYGHLAEKKAFPSSTTMKLFKPVEMEWGLFENPVFKELQLYQEIAPFEPYMISEEGEEKEVEVGRENPFIPY